MREVVRCVCCHVKLVIGACRFCPGWYAPLCGMCLCSRCHGR